MMKAPVFVKIDKYREVEDTISQIKAKLEDAKNIINQLSEIKAEEEREMQEWHEEIGKIEEKVSAVEHSMQR